MGNQKETNVIILIFMRMTDKVDGKLSQRLVLSLLFLFKKIILINIDFFFIYENFFTLLFFYLTLLPPHLISTTFQPSIYLPYCVICFIYLPVL